MARYKKDLGKLGELLALDFLKTQGLTLIGSNFQIWGGEIDLIMKEEKTIVFIEVKTRKDNRIEFTELMSDAKVHALSRAAEFWLIDNKLEKVDYRIDLIGILIANNKLTKLEWIKSVL